MKKVFGLGRLALAGMIELCQQENTDEPKKNKRSMASSVGSAEEAYR